MSRPSSFPTPRATQDGSRTEFATARCEDPCQARLYTPGGSGTVRTPAAVARKAPMASSFGHQFRIATFGESHGGGVGVVVDGCPAGLPLDLPRVQAQLARRRPGQSALTSPRDEKDLVEVLSGVDPDTGLTLGTALAMLVRNENQKSKDYGNLADLYRPSHADYT